LPEALAKAGFGQNGFSKSGKMFQSSTNSAKTRRKTLDTHRIRQSFAGNDPDANATVSEPGGVKGNPYQ